MSTPLSSSDPSDLANAARCFSSCIPNGMQQAVKTFLLANVTAAVTNPVCTAPSAPTGVSASNARVADPSTQMNVRWLQPANSGSFITGYVIKWGTVSGVYTNSMNVPLTPKNFTVTGLTPSTTYFFVVQAFAFAGCTSANSNEATGATAGGGSCTNGNTLASAWAARVVANGGAAPSGNTMTAIANFQCGLITDGLDTSMLEWNVFASDSLIASITPQLFIAGFNDPWTNNGPFVAGDLNASGLKGNGTTKFLNTGINTADPGFWGPNFPNNTGVTVYLATNTDVAQAVITGNSDGGASLFALEIFNGNTEIIMWDVATLINAANVGFTGYISANRTAINSLAIYEANSVTPHNTLATNVGNNTGNVSSNLTTVKVFCYTDNTGTSLFTGNRLSFIAYHKGLSLAQSALFSARVQTLMSALGRAI